MLQIVTDAIHDENDWPGILAGLADPDDIEARQARQVLATDELTAIRSAMRSMAEYIASTDTRATPAMVLGGHLGDGDETGVFDHVIRWVLDGTP